MLPVYIRIPKGPIGSALTSLPEVLMRIAWQKQDRTPIQLVAKGVVAMLESISPLEINPTMANPLPGFGSVTEVLANRNLFTGREVVPAYEQSSRPPEQQFGPETTGRGGGDRGGL